METQPHISTLVPGKLIIATYPGFPPVSYKNAAGQLVGLDLEFLTRFANQHTLEVLAIEKPFNGIWTLPNANECDIAAVSIMKRPDRIVGPNGSWSNRYFETQRALIVRPSEKHLFDDYENLHGKKIVVTRGAIAETDARQRYPHCTILLVDEVSKDPNNILGYVLTTLLAKHDIDAFGGGEFPNKFLCKKYSNQVAGGLVQADIHALVGVPDSFNFVVRNNSQGLLDSLNAFIDQNKKWYWEEISRLAALPENTTDN